MDEIDQETAPGGAIDDWPKQEPLDRIDTVASIGPTPILGGGAWGAPPPLFRPPTSTPLEETPEEADEADIPPAVLWPMKQQRHLHLGITPRDDERLRRSLGEEDATVYAIDDGPNHVMIGRLVGADRAGLTFSLVGRLDRVDFELCASGQSPLEGLFGLARQLTLLGAYVATDQVSNILLIERYKRIRNVPTEYLPPGPFLEFT